MDYLQEVRDRKGVPVYIDIRTPLKEKPESVLVHKDNGSNYRGSNERCGVVRKRKMRPPVQGLHTTLLVYVLGKIICICGATNTGNSVS